MLSPFFQTGLAGSWLRRKLTILTVGSIRSRRVVFQPTKITCTPLRAKPLAKPASYSPWNPCERRITSRIQGSLNPGVAVAQGDDVQSGDASDVHLFGVSGRGPWLLEKYTANELGDALQPVFGDFEYAFRLYKNLQYFDQTNAI